MSKRQKFNAVVKLGNQIVERSALQTIRDSTALWEADDLSALRSRLTEDGVILIRGLIPEKTALSARHLLLKTVDKKGAIADGTDYRDGIIACNRTGRLARGYTVDALSGGLTDNRDDDVEGWLAVGTSKRVSNVYDGTALRSFLSRLFGGADMFETLPENTWLRLKGQGDVTVEHADYYYFKRSTDMFSSYSANSKNPKYADVCLLCNQTASGRTRKCDLCHCHCHVGCIDQTARLPARQNWHCSECADRPIYLYTVWTCLGEVDISDSTLAFVPGSQKCTGFDRARINQQVPKQFQSFLDSTAYHIAENSLRPGDVFIFNIKTVHCASENLSGKFRVSIDTRVQLTTKGRLVWQKMTADSSVISGERKQGCPKVSES